MSAFINFSLNSATQRIPCKEVTAIGRDEGNDIVLDDSRVSRRHAVICRLQGDTYYLIDEGSSNGSLINAHRISLPTLLNNGDQITIGSVTLGFEQAHVENPRTQPTAVSHTATVVLAPQVDVVHTAILVADIRGFTRLSEAMPVRELTEVMNEWFRAATTCIKERHGIIDKFLGDCVYARWEGDRDAGRAVRRAIDSACRLSRLSQELNQKHPQLPQPFSIGAGVNFGIAAIGTDQGRTAIGDAVNLTFRLQEQTKKLGRNVLLAEAAYELLPKSRWSGREQVISVAGKEQAVNVCGFSFDEAEKLIQIGDDTERH